MTRDLLPFAAGGLFASRCHCVKRLRHAFQVICPLLVAGLVATSLNADPVLTSWLLNTTGAKGTSTDTAVNTVISQIDADIQQIRHTGTDAYINATGVPSYSIGPWLNPAVATDRNFVLQIPKAPQEQTGPKAPTPLGSIGQWVNGVAIYNAWDGLCFDDMVCDWKRDATVWELAGQDAANGHPAEVMGGGMTGGFVTGEYHHHFDPTALRAQLGDDGSSHSPILGFAYDGFPIYGPYGFENIDGTGGITRIDSSYQLRTGSRPDGPGGSFDGDYVEDWEYVAALGHLDEHNGRMAVTPEYPGGTYAYYLTLKSDLTTMYPHIVGPKYYGVLVAENVSQTVTVPANAVVFVPEPSAFVVVGFVGLCFCVSRVLLVRLRSFGLSWAT